MDSKHIIKGQTDKQIVQEPSGMESENPIYSSI